MEDKLERILASLEKLTERMADIDIFKALELLKLYTGENIDIIVNIHTPDCKRILQIFDLHKIEYETYTPSSGPPSGFYIHFGRKVDFRNLYIIVTLLKNFGLQSVLVSSLTYDWQYETRIVIGSYNNELNRAQGISASDFINIPFSISISTLLSDYYSTEEENDIPAYNDNYESGPGAYGYKSWDDLSFNEAYEGDQDAWDHDHQ